MGSSKGDDDRKSTQNDENPFIAFRRYADVQVSQFLQSVVGLPSTFTAPLSQWPPSQNSRQRHEEESKEGLGNVAKSEASDDRKAREERESGEAVNLPVKKFTGNPETSASNQGSGYQSSEMGFFQPDLVQSSDLVQSFLYNTPSVFRIMFGDNSSYYFKNIILPEMAAAMQLPYPIGYMLFSPYSPVYLERDERLRHEAGKWRAAFEDLMIAQEGQPIPERKAFSCGTDGGEWITELLNRGMLGGWERLGQTLFDRHIQENPSIMQALDQLRREVLGENERDESYDTEMDLYERFLGSQYAPPSSSQETRTVSSSSTSSTSSSASTNQYSSPGGSLGIVSTLTTTERTTMPDGSVQTKVVLKKRFADGREESSETIHRAHGMQDTHKVDSMTTTGEGREEASKEEGAKNQKKGWFWS
ncbi:MAG: hypothetical protein M1819_002913 [Sarea resinae]|nr:MAG: hypothetical protein M1819_002913 [Sarea resinae]